jgi:hypothetical protein
MVAIMTIERITTFNEVSCAPAPLALQKLANYHPALPGEKWFSHFSRSAGRERRTG